MSEDLRRVGHMVDCAKDLQGFLKGRRRDLKRNDMLRSAVLRKFEVMGEAATHVSAAFRAAHPEIPWKRIIAFRNVLIHAYDQIETDHLEVAIDALPKVLADLKTAQGGSG